MGEGGAIAEFEGGDNNSGGRTIAEFAGFDFTSTALQGFSRRLVPCPPSQV